MLTKKIIFLLCLLPLVALAKPILTEEIEIPLTPKEYISLYAPNKAIEKELLKVASCESNFKPNAIHYHDGGKGKHSFGIFQYQESTFLAFSKLFGEELDYYSYHDQIKLTAWIFAKHPELKDRWTCSKIMKVI